MAVQIPTSFPDKPLRCDRLQDKVRERRGVRAQASRDDGSLLPAMLQDVFGNREA
ncbi:hypothetical protein GALL_305780 [mine drainage metagenome]|uniref:Uncharacterized protein n=1 Tax=mine drainage metagenome TaxID=410659 RepID=A0A1J5RD37_9ZZZZ